MRASAPLGREGKTSSFEEWGCLLVGVGRIWSDVPAAACAEPGS